MESLLVRIPIGTPLTRVTAELDSAEFVSSEDFESRAHYRIDADRRFVRVVSPYRESPFGLTHRVCDAPALRVSIMLDITARVSSLHATTDRGCIQALP